MVKILSLVPYKIFPAQVGGQKGIALFNEYLAKERTLICVTVKGNDPAFAKNYRVMNILSGSALRYINIFYFFTLRRIIRQEQITHLLIEHPYYGWLGMLLKQFTGVKLVVHSHNIEALRWKTLKKWWWKVLFFYEKLTHRAADYNFFIHEEDRLFAVNEYKLEAGKAATITYGITWNRPPTAEEKGKAKESLRSLHQVSAEEQILLFNGSFDYPPNLDALQNIVTHIDRLLQSVPGFRYKIIIAGKHIPPSMINENNNVNIIFAGFVDDISLYFKGADVFINPVVDGGGIKTKLVEALGYNLTAVSTRNGAIGVDPLWCDGKLLICNDRDWQAFTELVIQSSKSESNIPPAYFEHFYWENIARKAASFIQYA